VIGGLIIISIRSYDGTASQYSDVSADSTQSSQRRLRARSARNATNNAVTKNNLEKNDSALANQVRSNQAQSKVDRVDAVFEAAANEQLPSKTKQQLLEDGSGFSPMERFLETVDDCAGGPVDVEAWNNLMAHDPLAAELGSI
jgi:hypothetical protein